MSYVCSRGRFRSINVRESTRPWLHLYSGKIVLAGNAPALLGDTRDAELPLSGSEEAIDLAATPLGAPAQLRAEELRDPWRDARGSILELVYETQPTGEDVVERQRQLVPSGPRDFDLEVIVVRRERPKLAGRRPDGSHLRSGRAMAIDERSRDAGR